MEKKLAIAVIHGMGSQEPDFADAMIREINSRLENRHGKNSQQVAWQPIYWSDVLEDRELSYLQDAKSDNNLDYGSLRKFIVTALGDAAAYQQPRSRSNTTYRRIHNRFGKAMNQLWQRVQREDTPLIIMAHSLGGVIASNYIWDAQCNKSSASSRTSFEQMQSLAGIITFGCNIPLFSFAYDPIAAIEFPPSTLNQALKQKAKWLNFFDPDDVLSYPLRPLSDSYKKVVSEDIAINVGSLLQSWNPASHAGYWTDNSFTVPVAAHLATFL